MKPGITPTRLFVTLALWAMVSVRAAAENAPLHLPGEPGAEEILDGKNPFPPSPPFQESFDDSGFASSRLGRVPAPGVHPRILISPDQLPDLRRRLHDTAAGRAMLNTLRERTGQTIRKPGAWENEVFERLQHGETTQALALIDAGKPPSYPPGHYQPALLYPLMLEAFDCLIAEDAERGRAAAAAIASYAAMIEPRMEQLLREPLADDLWRIRIAGSATGKWTDNQGLRELFGYQILGYAYDFAHPYMSEAQRTQVRRLIARATGGRIWLGGRLPHHWRNWNWIMVGLSQPLLALAIEGEEGYDPRVFQLGVNIARDYLRYGISPSGASTEAVGYTQFGFVWGVPFMVAAERRGERLLTQSHHRAMIDWYLHSMEPYAGRESASTALRDGDQEGRRLSPYWTSHGDGGNEGPAVWTMAMWKYFFPADPKIDRLWRVVANTSAVPAFSGQYHLVEPMLWCSEAPPLPPEEDLGQLQLGLTWFDPVRSSLVTRNNWSADGTVVQFESRSDSRGPSHEHADRGNFTLTALGRPWAKESFRSVETRHHNSVLIDGLGQGYWPGPGEWLGLVDQPWALLAATDCKYAYDWWWPKTILTDPADSVRFQYKRWATYAEDAAQWRQKFGAAGHERDPSGPVREFFEGFEQTGPRLWDEDGWTMRQVHNPVRRAFRTLAFVRGEHPYLLIVDDIQKDESERLYEWLMMTGLNTELLRSEGNDLVLGDASVARSRLGLPQPQDGDRQLLVRVLACADPASPAAYPAKPSFRLETFEKKDTLAPGGRSFGLDKRLVVASRSVAPGFKILLFPHRHGEPLPQTEWDAAHTRLTVTVGTVRDEIEFAEGADGRTRVILRRAGQPDVLLPATKS